MFCITCSNGNIRGYTKAIRYSDGKIVPYQTFYLRRHELGTGDHHHLHPEFHEDVFGFLSFTFFRGKANSLATGTLCVMVGMDVQDTLFRHTYAHVKHVHWGTQLHFVIFYGTSMTTKSIILNLYRTTTCWTRVWRVKIGKLMSRTNYFANNMRIGEASNPGPTQEQDNYRLAFVNPTAILHRVSDVMDLQSDIVALAETSATAPTQIKVAQTSKQYGYSCTWSPPVDSQKQRLDGEISFRGLASGTGFISKLPIRQHRSKEHISEHHRTRLHFRIHHSSYGGFVWIPTEYSRGGWIYR